MQIEWTGERRGEYGSDDYGLEYEAIIDGLYEIWVHQDAILYPDVAEDMIRDILREMGIDV